MSWSVVWLRVRGLQRMWLILRGSIILVPSQEINAGARCTVTSRPRDVREMSERPVCWPEMDHSVSPCRARMTRGMTWVIVGGQQLVWWKETATMAESTRRRGRAHGSRETRRVGPSSVKCKTIIRKFVRRTDIQGG